ncbi:MAG TPA: hypothetical protein VNZ86_15865 [Bacteroidia bacterium]|jgi:hypothetical protein|nr:hypothetical protein [Bacteroidia bacterium]
MYRKIFFLLFFIPSVLQAQNGSPAPAATFLYADVLLDEGEIVSNVLKIPPATGTPFSFTIFVSAPGKWRMVGNKDKIYTTSDKDTLYIPIRIIPGDKKGNAQYFLTAILRDENGKQRTSASFTVSTKKQTQWELSVLPTEKIYFLNGQTTVPFSLNVLNTGNEVQDILLTFHEIGKNSILTDSMGLILKKRYFNLSLGSLRDTTLKFKFSYYEGKRNFRRVDLETHNPSKQFEAKKYSLFFRTQDPKLSSATSFSSNKKVDFIKLNSSKKVTPFDSYVIPLTVEANIYNILGIQPIMNLVLRGNTLLGNGANLVYYGQMNYTSYNYTPTAFNSSSFFLGYYHTWGNIQIGNVTSGNNLGIPTSGRGITGEYRINRNQTIGGFFTESPGILSHYRTAFGLNYKIMLPLNQMILASAGRVQDQLAGSNTNFLGARYIFNIRKTQQFGLSATGSQNTSTLIPNSSPKLGYLIAVDYSGIFLDRKLIPTLRIDYNTRSYYNTNSEHINILHRSNYELGKKRSLSLQNNYSSYELPVYNPSGNQILTNKVFSNFLYYSVNNEKGRVMPGLFYNFTDFNNVRLHYRGVSFDYNTFSLENNVRFSFNTRGGYNWLQDYPSIPEFFSASVYSLLQYHTVSFNARYNYGYQSVYNVADLTGQNPYPQVIYLSLQHQYLFSDSRFVLQSSVNYSYQNATYSHSFGFFPELYFYSYNGWRFKINAGYNLNSSNVGKAALYQNGTVNPSELNTTPVISQGFMLGFGVKKDFGIPIPKRLRKKVNYTMEFVAFMDLNGNRIMDKDEIPLENVVLHIGEHELITDSKGMARLVNIQAGYYTEHAASLNDLQGWFPLLDDSIQASNKTFYIPFVRGVKIFGDVMLEREKFSEDVTLDLSRIKITATDSFGKPFPAVTDKHGSYVIYVPLGKYTITMDEKILDDAFNLTQNNYPVVLKQGVENIYTPFYIVEKKRKINLKKFTQEDNGDKKEDKKPETKEEKKPETNDQKKPAPKPDKKTVKKPGQKPVKKDSTGTK